MSDNHGNTPAAWTAVMVALAGFVVAGIGVISLNWPTIWIGFVIIPASFIVLAVMNRMGLGSAHH